MLGEASAAISSIKAALDIAKGAASLKSEAEINLAVIGIQRALLDAQSAALDDRESQASQQKRIAELESEIRSFRGWEMEKARYQLTESPTGALIYELKSVCTNGEPIHRLCVKCFNEDRKSVLQIVQKHGGGESVRCHHCDDKLTLSKFPPIKFDGPSTRSAWSM